ncbi:hypoxanthine-guanine phosphoribosyltransferase [Entomoplasma ellychniae]|uniref:Hypoxanthine phosphoribosyltransferase n=1 Tax=Entomoplasma ellychniae TaxID=2114 RepID=A0A8E2QVH0_9MOLU|nr:hypoxanthine phosphoribosyltransferase [Entomoplasma ellychniae]PPE04432.1 hypoxanthine-guanine phosphoribosyltransferase [Entomoplasma ellychniae]
MALHPLVKRVLLTEEQIKTRVAELATEVAEHYKKNNIKDKDIVVVGILKGCVPFYAEFFMNFKQDVVMDFMVISSYLGGLKSNKQPKINLDLNSDIKNKHVLIVEDIVDTGHTLSFLKDYLKSRKAASVNVVTLVDKPGGRKIEFEANFIGFSIENEFVIGYGLDYDEKLRNLPYIAIMDTDKLKTWEW